ncbi:MAG: SUMF1/EgtB/PvdO family nonheme iron enzyme [Candidatus Latescibacterota bacterium]|jgi:iron(II)-dependent oxidoreductase
MDNWVWWILTCGFSLYFVILLLEFNRPAQKLMEQIDNQEIRRQDMERRLERAQEETTELRAHLEELQLRWDDLDERRKDILPEANSRLMIKIPAGPFTMGGREEDTPRNEGPVHTVYMATYYVGRFPVTNIEYREFVQCTGHRSPIHWQRGTYPTGTGQHPVVNVSWPDSQAYAQWRGARLPSEAEWEKAARGTDERPYPWGTRFVEEEKCNCNNNVGMTTAVNEYPEGRSPYGIWDMAGNVFEWCSDYYDEEYYKTSPGSNPRGPEGGQERVVRGGCFSETRASVRTTARFGVSELVTRDNLGFRIAMDA